MKFGPVALLLLCSPACSIQADHSGKPEDATSDGLVPSPMDDIARFESRHPPETKPDPGFSEDDVPRCLPDCDGKECGDDGCGGDCGFCGGEGKECFEGLCYETLTSCGDGICQSWEDASLCLEDCPCKMSCSGSCHDACVKWCGACETGSVCLPGGCRQLGTCFDRTYGPLHSAGSAVAALSDGGYAVAGSVQTAEGYDLLVLRLDPDGEPLWERVYDRTPMDRGVAVREADGGELLVAARSAPVGEVEQPPEVWILRLDPDGALVWEDGIVLAMDTPGTPVRVDGEEGFVIIAGGPRIVRVSPQGEVIEEIVFSAPPEVKFNTVARGTSGTCWVTGAEASGSYDPSDEWVARVDATGEVAWSGTFGGEWTEGLAAIAADPSGGVVAAGSISENEYSSYGWAFRLGPDDAQDWVTVFEDSKHQYIHSLLLADDDAWWIGGRGFLARLGPDGTLRWDDPNARAIAGMDILPQGGVVTVDGTKDRIHVAVRTGAQPWEAVLGGPEDDFVGGVAVSDDGQVGVAGTVFDDGGQGFDVRVAVHDVAGDLLWDQTLGGTGDDRAAAVLSLPNSGWLAAGHTSSEGAGGRDGWLIRLDGAGEVLWDTTFGGVSLDRFHTLAQVGDGTFVAVGETASSGAGNTDLWFVHVASDGAVLHETVLGGEGEDRGRVVRSDPAGSFLVAGERAGQGTGLPELWILRLDVTGAVVSQSLSSVDAPQVPLALLPMADGWVVSTELLLPDAGDPEAALRRVGLDGEVLWEKNVLEWQSPPGQGERVLALDLLPDGSIVAVGRSLVSGAHVDGFVRGLDPNSGVTQWEWIFGGGDDDGIAAVSCGPDGRCAFAGFTASRGVGGKDLWVIHPRPPRTDVCN